MFKSILKFTFIFVLTLNMSTAFASLKINTSFNRIYDKEALIYPEINIRETNIEKAYDYDLFLFDKFYKPINLISNRDIYYSPNLRKKDLKSRKVPNVYNISFSNKNKEMLTQAKNYEAQKNYQKAELIYKELVKREPKNSDLLYRYAVCLEKIKSFPIALETLNKVIKLNPDLYLSYFLKGNIYYQTGHFQEAIREYKNSIDKNPDYANAFYNIACVFEKLNEKQLALKYYKTALGLLPDDVEIQNSVFRLEKQISQL